MRYRGIKGIKKYLNDRKFRKKILNGLKENKSLPRPELDYIIRKKLQKLLLHAQMNVPYYSKLFKIQNFDSTDFTIENLSNLPILTKKICQNHLSDLIAQNMSEDDWVYHSTSGSTGEPFQFCNDRHFGLVRGANDLYFQDWIGYQKNKDRMLQIVGHCPNSFLLRIINRIFRKRVCILAWEMEDKNKLKKILSFKPHFIYGYTSAILKLARYVEKSKIKLTGIRGVITTSETLTKQQRKVIESNLNAPIFDQYGSREFGLVAGECKSHNGLHIIEESFIVEIVHDPSLNTDNNVGRLILTCLDNFSMPFIRYDTGDLAEFSTSTCNCGKSSKLLSRIIGRVTDFITLPSGKKVSYLFFNSFFEDYGPYIQDFQVNQYKDSLVIKVVPLSRFTPEIRQKTIQGIESLIDKELKVKIQEVTSIPLESSGKRMVIKLHI